MSAKREGVAGLGELALAVAARAELLPFLGELEGEFVLMVDDLLVLDAAGRVVHVPLDSFEERAAPRLAAPRPLVHVVEGGLVFGKARVGLDPLTRGSRGSNEGEFEIAALLLLRGAQGVYPVELFVRPVERSVQRVADESEFFARLHSPGSVSE